MTKPRIPSARPVRSWQARDHGRADAPAHAPAGGYSASAVPARIRSIPVPEYPWITPGCPARAAQRGGAAHKGGSASVWCQTRKARLWAMGLDSYGPAPEHKASLTKYHAKPGRYRERPGHWWAQRNQGFRHAALPLPRRPAGRDPLQRQTRQRPQAWPRKRFPVRKEPAACSRQGARLC